MSDEPEVDEELAIGLRQARKKPRNFAIIAKGPNVLKVLVERKPLKAGALQGAKSEFKGNNIIKGVVQQEGDELVFRVVGEEPSVKAAKFKQFISAATGLKVKPRFEVVNELAEVDDDGNEAEGNEAEGHVEQNSGGQNSDDQDSGGQNSGDEGNEAETAEAPVEAPAKTPAEAIPDAPPLAEPEAESNSAVGKALLAALAKISPAIKAATAANPTRAGEVVSLVSQFKQEAAANKAEEGKSTLAKLVALIKQLNASNPAPTSQPNTQTEATNQPEQPVNPAPTNEEKPVNPNAGKWEQEFGRVEPLYAEAIKKADSKLASQLRVLMTYATEQAEAGVFEKSLAALKKLEPFIEQALASSVTSGAESEIAAGIVEKRKFLLTRWKMIPPQIDQDLKGLQQAIAKQVPEEDPAELIDAMTDNLQEFYGEMQDAIDSAINSGDGDYKAAHKLIDGFKKELSSNALVRHLESNKLGAKVSVEAILFSALDEVASSLAS